jgi:SAM-dependent methyltransferase
MPGTNPDDRPADPVAEQYERWIYPEACDDLSLLPLTSPEMHFNDLRSLYWAFWPAGPYREDLDILVAGCGSLAAAAYAFLFPKARVWGIDISTASLAQEELLRQKHGLTNLTLGVCRVEDAASLGRQFDFIACHGVLHHMADPAAGLKALGEQIRPDGVIDIMLYAPFGRAGVYMFQELFRLMGLGQEPADLEVVHRALAAVGPQHPLHRYLRLATDLHSPAGMVDTFLHRRDRPFSVRECLELVCQAGLVFQGWHEPGYYFPDSRLGEDSPFRADLERLPEPERWQAVELVDGTIPGHWFYACRPERPAASYRIGFDGASFLDDIPLTRISQASDADPLGNRPAMIARPPIPAIGLAPWQAAVFARIDGRRTVRQCLEAAGLQGDWAAIVAAARDFFRSLWRVGYVLFRRV